MTLRTPQEKKLGRLAKRCVAGGMVALAAGAVLTLGAALPTQADVIVFNDTFTDGGRTNGGDPLDINWWTRQNTTLAVNSTAPTITGNALKVDWTTGTSNFGQFLGVFSTSAAGVAIDNVADQIYLSFDFQRVGASTTGFRFGLYNRNGNNHTADGNNTSDNDFGYRTAILWAGDASGPSFGQEVGTNSQILTGSDVTGTITNNASVSGYAAPGTTTHKVEMTITRTSATQVDLAIKMDGVLLRTAFDSSGIYTSFHEIAFGTNGGGSGAGVDLIIDNVLLETRIIPEPASLALLGLGGLLMFGRRRRENA